MNWSWGKTPMKHPLIRLITLFALFSTLFAHGNTLYVDVNSANPMPPYFDWSTAATNIQDAIDAAADGDQIWVTNGVYQTGGKVMAGNLTNRVALDKAVTVQSVNGPFVTTIEGIGATNGVNAVRCAWLTNNAALIGFTITRGATQTTGDFISQDSGGGIWCASSNALVRSCVIISNAAFARGGAAYQGTLENCFISGNRVQQSALGGAIYSAILNNCTAISNSCAGFVGCVATNSICYYGLANNYSGGSFSYCCVTPAAAGIGNFTNAPLIYPDRIHLSPGSPGVGAGTTTVTGTDIFGRAWSSPPSVGCAESGGAPYVLTPQVQLTGSPVGFSIMGSTLGDQPLTYAWLKNGAPLQGDARLSGTQSTNLIALGVNFTDAGNYQFVASNNWGMVTSAVAQVVIHCVNGAGSNPVAPYTSWDTAATNIQDAVDAAAAGELVLVTNGVYSTGGKVMSGDLTNRVAADKALTVISVNGYASTIIEGKWDSATNGPAAVRCAWLTNGATLSGFTLRNGATRGGNVINVNLNHAGGAWLSSNALISNCVITNNGASYGGGAALGPVNNCFIGFNSALHGGGAYSCRLYNCTVRHNYSPFGSNVGAGVESCVSRNCIVSDNYTSPDESQLLNYATSSLSDIFTNCCTTPLPSRGSANMINSPLFLDPVFRLAPASPCRGAGSTSFATGNDLDNEPFANPPAMGCDELIATNLTGPLVLSYPYNNLHVIVNHSVVFLGSIEGRASEVDWDFGDGPTVTNLGAIASHHFANPGTYDVTITAYNLDNPLGVSSNVVVAVSPFLSPQIQASGMVSNSFQFSFPAQGYALYQVQYATNLTPPIAWQTLPQFFFSTNDTVMTVRDPAITNDARFYRIVGQ
jgi:hypothetical protein